MTRYVFFVALISAISASSAWAVPPNHCEIVSIAVELTKQEEEVRLPDSDNIDPAKIAELLKDEEALNKKADEKVEQILAQAKSNIFNRVVFAIAKKLLSPVMKNYERVKRRYGKRYARVTMSSWIVGNVGSVILLIPGVGYATAAMVMAVAEVHRQIRGGEADAQKPQTNLTLEDEQEMGSEGVLTLEQVMPLVLRLEWELQWALSKEYKRGSH